MACDERDDWVDRVMAQRAWEPPSDFAGRVAVHAMTALPGVPLQAATRVGFRESVRARLVGIRESTQARIEGSIWVLLQYRQLIWR